MNRSEFSSVVQRARDIINSLSQSTTDRQDRKRLLDLYQIIDNLEELHNNDPPLDWIMIMRLLIDVVMFLRQMFGDV